MKTYYKYIFLFIIILVSCRSSLIKESDIPELSRKEDLEYIGPEQFFKKMMTNRIGIKIYRRDYFIADENDKYVYLGYTDYNKLKLKEYYVVYKCDKADLKKSFPLYKTFNGIGAGRIIASKTNQIRKDIKKMRGYGENRNFVRKAYLTDTHMVFIDSHEWSVDDSPWRKLVFKIMIDKNDLDKVSVQVLKK